MYYDSIMVATIKLAVANLERVGAISKEVLLESIGWLRLKYEQEKDPIFLHKAICHVYAYLELGFPYEDGVHEFQKVLNYLNLDKDTAFSSLQCKSKKLKVTKYNIRNILGRWNPRLHSMKIAEVVSDIYDKVIEKKIGEYLYYSGKIISSSESDTLWEQTYWLYVHTDEAILYDVNRNKYYVFE